MAEHAQRLKARATLGKYRIVKRVGEGGFSTVYRARDTIEGVEVALKIPRAELSNAGALEELKHEVRLTARLQHENILPLKNAEMIDGRFVIAYPLGNGTLYDRLERRIGTRKALAFAEQMIDAVACSHAARIIHCDIKPENFILFPGDCLRLADFGIARVALRRMTLASGAGTIGYMAPEQAMGKPGYRSDVFSLGLVIYRMFAGALPEWPFDWPPLGFERVRRVLHPDMLELLRRCIEVDDRKRFADAVALQAAFRRLRTRALRSTTGRKRARKPRAAGEPAWRSLRAREFKRRFGRQLEAQASCSKCEGPLSESMRFCPFCSRPVRKYHGKARFPGRCKRCQRSLKRDWRFCPYCYGAAVQPPSERALGDRRYSARCHRCHGALMPFMRYCPHCRAMSRRRWKIEGSSGRCPGCGWGVLDEFWDHCPWCSRRIDGG